MASDGEEDFADEKKADDARSTLHRDVASVMAEPGFSITETRMDGGGWLLLHLTAFKGDAPCLAMLLEAVGADEGVNQVNAGATPLRFAAQGGHHRCMELLIAAGADANAATPGVERREERESMLEIHNTYIYICALQHAVAYMITDHATGLCAPLVLSLYISVSLCALCTVSLSLKHTISLFSLFSRSLALLLSILFFRWRDVAARLGALGPWSRR
jgi:hypothetical protein